MIWSSSSDTGKEFVKRREIPALVSGELVIGAWHEWQRWKRFGLAHGKGWIHERPIYVRAIEICEQEFEHWQYRKASEHGRQ